jgi:hypothetical protein
MRRKSWEFPEARQREIQRQRRARRLARLEDAKRIAALSPIERIKAKRFSLRSRWGRPKEIRRNGKGKRTSGVYLVGVSRKKRVSALTRISMVSTKLKRPQQTHNKLKLA